MGKTIVFSSIIEEQVRKGDKVLILAHREELLKQAADKLEKTTGLKAAVEKAEQTSIGTWNRVVVGSIQTLFLDKRLQQFKPDEFGTIIIDEAHHALSDTYRKVLDYFSEAKVLGVTATPDRGDRKDLGEIFESLAYDYSIVRAIKDGYLSPIKAQTIPLDIDLSQVGIQNGDFASGEIATALDPYLEQIAEEMKKYCKGRKTLVFLPLIATSQKFTKLLQEKGLKAMEVNGQSKDRQQILKDFEDGKYDILCNALLLTEGYDCPAIDCIVMLRPTKIRSMYCLDEQTEILTNNGWKTFETFSMIDKVATFNPETEMINFEKSLAYIHRPLNENECFYSLNSPSLDIRVTNKHRMLYDNKRGKGWKFKTAEELAEMKDGAYIPVSGKSSFKGVPLSDDELRFIGWVMTDGNINKYNNVISISQSDTQKWLNDIEECLKKCNFKYGKHINNSKTQFKRNGNNVVWYISKGKPRMTDTDKRGWEELEKYISKDIADELFFNISEEQFDVMLEAINLADGHKQSSSEWQQHSYHIGKGNKRFIERLQIMAIQRGYKANLSIQTEKRRKNPYYVLHMKKKTKACCGSTYDGRPVWEKEDFKEENCWCVETPTGTLITRRNGKVAILGNCQAIGRGTRIAEGKDHLLLLDFLWHTQRHDLCRPAHLIAKDEIYAKKMTEKYAETEDAVDLLSMEDSVAESVLEERENALAAELKKQRMKKAKLVDPLQYEMSIAAADLVDYVPEFGWQMTPATDKQIDHLEKLGIYGGDIPNSGYASMLIERVEKRKASGLTSPKQIRQLENRGFINVGQWSFQDAQKLIGRIAKCGWRVPPGIDPVEYSRKVLSKK